MSRILLVPSVRRGNGSGHLSRCLSLAAELGAEAAVYLPDDPGEGAWSADELRLAYPRELERVTVVGSPEPPSATGLVVLDRRETSPEELLAWSELAPVVGIDEGGPARARFDYLIDVMPVAPSRLRRGFTKPNRADLGFLSLPKARREPPKSPVRVLVSFGGEDPADLAEAFLALALGKGYLKPESVTLVAGALSRGAAAYPGVQAIGSVQNLKERLKAYDLVVTQFGLTAFEAAWAGCAVLLLNPSAVHEELAGAAGFASLGVGKPAEKALAAWLGDWDALVARSLAAAPAERRDLAAVLSGLRPRHAGACPACGGRSGESLYRAARKTYLRCPDCGLARMEYFEPRDESYTGGTYFFDDYKAQYGRTYIEDLPAIRAMASKRLTVIEGLLGRPVRGSTLLDVGCAYGAFVAEAQERGWSAAGCDIAPDAVDYVKATFGAPAFVADFSAPAADGLYPRGLDCLSLWYVIEHFDELSRVLSRAANLLRPGGVLAFSTPSSTGVSARLRPDDFWERSPDDHFTVWAPGRAEAILKRFGFEVQRIVVTGHHPERFPGGSADPASLRYRLLMAASRLMKLGDTFECYARYTGSDREPE